MVANTVLQIFAHGLQLSSDAGLGLFSTRGLHAPEHGNGKPWWLRWWPRVGAHAEPVTLASFPLSSAITANNICKDPSYGAKYRCVARWHTIAYA